MPGHTLATSPITTASPRTASTCPQGTARLVSPCSASTPGSAAAIAMPVITPITIESVLTAVYGTVLGVLTGIAIAAALPGVLAEQGLTSLAVPWGQVLAVLGLAVVIGLVASVWPGIRASRLPVLEAVTVD